MATLSYEAMKARRRRQHGWKSRIFIKRPGAGHPDVAVGDEQRLSLRWFRQAPYRSAEDAHRATASPCGPL
jgi:hypothetical protein